MHRHASPWLHIPSEVKGGAGVASCIGRRQSQTEGDEAEMKVGSSPASLLALRAVINHLRAKRRPRHRLPLMCVRGGRAGRGGGAERSCFGLSTVTADTARARHDSSPLSCYPPPARHLPAPPSSTRLGPERVKDSECKTVQPVCVYPP